MTLETGTCKIEGCGPPMKRRKVFANGSQPPGQVKAAENQQGVLHRSVQTSAKDGRLEPGKSAPVLPWMRVPITFEATDGIDLEDVSGLSCKLRTALQENGVEMLFPVQSVVWLETAGGSSTQHDICISAPTGSGKTLAYALPLLQALSRGIRGLRALVVLPTRDLAGQVYQVFASLCPALGLTACVTCGKVSMAEEAQLLASGSVDIMVTTPGRLISHMEGTPGWDLGRLSFLVIDETDRLLRQDYQGWLPKLLAAVDGTACHAQRGALLGVEVPPLAGAPSAALPLWPDGGISVRRVVKFVVSATLSKDPSKLERLGLYCPRYITMSAVDHRYKLPPQLEEFKLVVPAERKPLVLVALLAELGAQQTIVFTSSVEASHRLCVMLQALTCLPGRVVEFSSLLRPHARRQALEDFRSGAAKVLVCSDAMTRGMDVEGVGAVVNYDSPVYVKTYVHRAGRTARAGRCGQVFTLLRHEDVKHFKGMLRKADNTYVRDYKLGRERMAGLLPDVEQALLKMQAAVSDTSISGILGQSQRRDESRQLYKQPKGSSVRNNGARKRRLHGVEQISLVG